MSRSTSVLLLVLLAATSGPTGAQSATTAGWTIASGDYTIYGHTDYIPAILVLPRLAWDTTHGWPAPGWPTASGRSRSRCSGPGSPRA